MYSDWFALSRKSARTCRNVRNDKCIASLTTLHLQASADAALPCKPRRSVTRGGHAQTVPPTEKPYVYAQRRTLGNTALFFCEVCQADFCTSRDTYKTIRMSISSKLPVSEFSFCGLNCSFVLNYLIFSS